MTYGINLSKEFMSMLIRKSELEMVAIFLQ